jgi:hypothetical protein
MEKVCLRIKAFGETTGKQRFTGKILHAKTKLPFTENNISFTDYGF